MVEIVLLNGKCYNCSNLKGYVEIINDVALKYKFNESYLYINFVDNIQNDTNKKILKKLIALKNVFYNYQPFAIFK